MPYEEIDQEVDRTIRRYDRISTVMPPIARWIYDIEWARTQKKYREETAQEWKQLDSRAEELFDELTSTSERILMTEGYNENRVEALQKVRDECLELTHSIQQLNNWYLYQNESERVNQLLNKAGNYMSLVEYVLWIAETRRLEFELTNEFEGKLDEIENNLETHVSNQDPRSYSLEKIEELRVKLQQVDERIAGLITEITSESEYETLQEFRATTDLQFDQLTIDPSAVDQPNSTGGLRERGRALESRLDQCERDHLLVVARETLDDIDAMVETQYETTGSVDEYRNEIAEQLESVSNMLDSLHELTDGEAVRPAVEDVETRFKNRQERFGNERLFASNLDEGDQLIESFRTEYREYTTSSQTPIEYIARADWNELETVLSQAEETYRRTRQHINDTAERTRLLQAVVRERIEQTSQCRERLNDHNTRFAANIGQKYPEVFIDSEGNELNNRQKESVIADDSRILVPAAAGTGKTKTIVHKLSYLINIEGVPAERTLVAGFAKASVTELNERIGDPGVEARTLHSLAKEVTELIEHEKTVINKDSGNNEIKKETKRLIQRMLDDNSDYYSSNFERDYLRLIKHTADIGPSSLSQVTTQDDGITPSGLQRVEFFLDKHGFEYVPDKLIIEGEEDGTEDNYRADIYLPNYDIVISHVPVVDTPPDTVGGPIAKLAALDQQSDNVQTRGRKSFEQIKTIVQWEQQLFEKISEKTLIYTYGWEDENNVLSESLETKLVEQFAVPVPADSDLYIRRKNKYFENGHINEFAQEKLAEGVGIARNRGLPSGGIDSGLQSSPTDVLNDGRTDTGRIADIYPDSSPLYKYFGKVLDQLYNEYVSYLDEKGLTDFSGMLQRATKFLCECPDHDDFEQFVFDYIIIDEFQDISPTQMRFIASLLQLNDDAQLFCVGDDWQSIFAFRGGTSYYFLNFDEIFNRPTNTITLQKSYRNPQTVVNASIRLIENNETQLSKDIQAASNDYGVITIHESESQNSSSRPPQMAQDLATLVTRYLETAVGTGEKAEPSEIRVLVKNEHKSEEVMSALDKQDISNKYNPNGEFSESVPVETPFNAKGKDAKHVLIYRALDNEYGSFPEVRSKDKILTPIKQKEDNTFQVERREFYVALTRTSQTIDIFTSESKDVQSRFIRELRPDFGDKEESASPDKRLERLLDHGVWYGDEPVLEQTPLTGETAFELVEHAYTETKTGVDLFRLFSALVTSGPMPDCSSNELVSFYHWYVEQADEYITDRNRGESLEAALYPFTGPVAAHNDAMRQAYEHLYHEEPLRELLNFVDKIREKPLLDSPDRPDGFENIINKYVFEIDLASHDCPTVALLLEQTASGLHNQPKEAQRLMTCAEYLDKLESQYESLIISYPFCSANELRRRVPAVESVSALLLNEEQLIELRKLKKWSRTPDQFDIVAAVSHVEEPPSDHIMTVHSEVNPRQVS